MSKFGNTDMLTKYINYEVFRNVLHLILMKVKTVMSDTDEASQEMQNFFI